MDLSQIPTEELVRLRDQSSVSPGQDLSKVPTEELMRMRDAQPLALPGSQASSAERQPSPPLYHGTEPQTAEPPVPGFKGSILPVSREPGGKAHLDLGAGIPGFVGDILSGAKSGFTYPGDVAAGRAPPDDPKRVIDTVSLGMPVNPAVRMGDKAIPGVATAARRNVPTTTELSEAGSAGYQRVFGNPDKDLPGMTVDYAPKAIQTLSAEVDKNLFARGITPDRAPETYGVLTKLQSPPDGAVVSLANLHAARETLSDIALKSEGAEKYAATRMVRRLDDFIAAPPAEGVLAGPAAAAGAEFTTARRNTAAGKRSNEITGELDKAVTGIGERADLAAATANSGQNVDNTIRQHVKNFIKNKNNLRGFNEEEIAALARVAEGTGPRNALRTVGNLGGGGLGLGTSFFGAGVGGYGAATGSPLMAGLGFGIPAAGIGARQAANALTGRALNKADELIRTRSPLYESGGAGQYVPNPEKRMSLLRALIAARDGE